MNYTIHVRLTHAQIYTIACETAFLTNAKMFVLTIRDIWIRVLLFIWYDHHNYYSSFVLYRNAIHNFRENRHLGNTKVHMIKNIDLCSIYFVQLSVQHFLNFEYQSVISF